LAVLDVAIWSVVGIVVLYFVARLGIAWLVPNHHRNDRSDWYGEPCPAGARFRSASGNDDLKKCARPAAKTPL